MNLLDLQYTLGQRWTSNTEPELGLGVVTECDDRRITLHFPAAEEARTYAIDNAPINRVEYQVGDIIADANGLRITVTDTQQVEGYRVYAGVDEAGEARQIPELALDSFVQFRRPQDRLFTGQIDKLSQYKLRYQALAHREALAHSPARGLVGARVQLLPHQLHIAHEVANRFAPRVLLADEVGLGKTIEAGLILHHQLQTGRAQRVLICVPASLVHQWLVEMLRRFNLSFTILDEDRCQALIDTDHNPFNTAQLVLCSLDFFTQNPQRQQQAQAAGWDLLVVDEAHHLEWTENPDDPRRQNYQAIANLAQHSLGLLLLTATPEQLGEASHFARLQLLDPHHYHDFARYQQEEENYGRVNQLVEKLNSDNPAAVFTPTSSDTEQLQTFIGESKTQALLDGLQSNDPQAAITTCLDQLLDHHGTGRVLFRNTRDSVKGFPTRQLVTHPLATPEAYAQHHTHHSMAEQLQPELVLGSDWLETDSRIGWLIDWLKQHRQEKVLLICHRLETALDLEDHLRIKRGLRTTAFHEELSLVERDRAAAYFADAIDGAQIMICSEIGSEGRNFQFAHHLVLFDLPFHPDLLEQRIGRLARIGQTDTVQIHTPFYQLENSHTANSTPMERLLTWYHQGLNAVENPCPPAAQVFEQYRDDLETALAAPAANHFEQLLEQTQQTVAELRAKLAAGRDRLLELNSCKPEQAAKIIERIEQCDQDPALPDFMSAVFDEFAVDEDHHSEDAIVLHPTEHMHSAQFPGLTDDGLTATYNRNKALSREDMAFLTWEHPMVEGVLDILLGREMGNTALGTIKLPPLKPGSVLLEAVLTVHCPGPKALQLAHYFPQHRLRILLEQEKDLAAVISFQQLNKLHTPVGDKKTSGRIIRHAKPDIIERINHCQKLADQKRDNIVAAAMDTMEKAQAQALDRLQTLAEVNPSIRPDEIEHLRNTTDTLRQHLAQTQLSLEMVRVIICT